MPSVHGVLMRVDACGVLITGRAGSGKSSLALALMARGHSLVADDAPELQLDGNRVTGQCPPMLRGLLHCPVMGVVDVQALHGNDAWCESTDIHLMIKLCDAVATTSDLDGQWQTTSLCEVEVPTLPLLPNRMIEPAVQVEAAVRTVKAGALAADTLRALQAQAMRGESCS